MLSLSEVLKHTIPSFAMRVRWAAESGDREALAALRAEDPTAYAKQAQLHREAQKVSKESATDAGQILKLSRERRAALLIQGRVTVTDEVRTAIVDDVLGASEAVRVTKAWWSRRETPWLVLCGSPGCGKSVAAAAQVAAHGGLWLSADELVQAFASLFGDASAMQQRTKEAPLLVIDELGGEVDPSRMTTALLQLLSRRNSTSKHPVIVTTNLTFESMAARYPNDRLRARLNELVTWYPLASVNLRPTRPRLFSSPQLEVAS